MKSGLVNFFIKVYLEHRFYCRTHYIAWNQNIQVKKKVILILLFIYYFFLVNSFKLIFGVFLFKSIQFLVNVKPEEKYKHKIFFTAFTECCFTILKIIKIVKLVLYVCLLAWVVTFLIFLFTTLLRKLCFFRYLLT